VSWNVDPLDLFPLFESIEGTYDLAKAHSAAVDRILGFQIEEIEARLSLTAAHWAGLSPSTLLTPYTEFRFALSKVCLNPGDHVVELGSGYSRLAHVLGAHEPDIFYSGIECVLPRAHEAQRIIVARGLKKAEVMTHDLFSKGSLPDANVYFLYDLSSNLKDTRAILEQLKERARKGAITLVGRGKASRTQIEREHPWLSAVVDPEHFGNFSVYRSG
jgi:hypothetical protein